MNTKEMHVRPLKNRSIGIHYTFRIKSRWIVWICDNNNKSADPELNSSDVFFTDRALQATNHLCYFPTPFFNISIRSWHNPSALYICLSLSLHLWISPVYLYTHSCMWEVLYSNQKPSSHCNINYKKDIVRNWGGSENCSFLNTKNK